MSITVVPGFPFVVTLEAAPSGLVGVLGITARNTGGVVIAPTTSLVEHAETGGVSSYTYTGTWPSGATGAGAVVEWLQEGASLTPPLVEDVVVVSSPLPGNGSVVAFVDYVPTPRWDGTPWLGVRIDEAPTADGPWTQIDDVTFAVADPDPAAPAPRTFVTHDATMEAGWYRVRYHDANGEQSAPTTPTLNAPTGPPWRPTALDVAGWVRARTKDRFGNEQGRFTKDTRPTAAEVERLIDSSLALVTARVGGVIPLAAQAVARDAVSLRVAMRVEMSYAPDQVGSDRSPYSRMKDLYDEAVAALDIAYRRGDDTEGPDDDEVPNQLGYLVVDAATPQPVVFDPITGARVVRRDAGIGVDFGTRW